MNFTNLIDICNELNNYFCSVGEKLSQSIHPSGQFDFKRYSPQPCTNSMFCSNVTSKEIFKVIHNFPNNKAPGPDGIIPKLLKEICDDILFPLTYIYNLSFSTGVVPDVLKIAKIIPIYKKDDRNKPGNYRPISLLSIFDKILEKLMYKRLSSFLEMNKFLYEYQFGFRKNHSTVHAVMEVIDAIYEHCDNNEITMGIYIDLQKAFDTVNHEILIQKLENCGVRGTVLEWFSNYLSNRKQYTVLLNNESTLESVKLGVPQGSVLGQLLFLIYVNDIQYAVTGAKIKLFAVDTNLFIHGSNINCLFDLANICFS
jgi:hypothetical protein